MKTLAIALIATLSVATAMAAEPAKATAPATPAPAATAPAAPAKAEAPKTEMKLAKKKDHSKDKKVDAKSPGGRKGAGMDKVDAKKSHHGHDAVKAEARDDASVASSQGEHPRHLTQVYTSVSCTPH